MDPGPTQRIQVDRSYYLAHHNTTPPDCYSSGFDIDQNDWLRMKRATLAEES